MFLHANEFGAVQQEQWCIILVLEMFRDLRRAIFQRLLHAQLKTRGPCEYNHFSEGMRDFVRKYFSGQWRSRKFFFFFFFLERRRVYMCVYMCKHASLKKKLAGLKRPQLQRLKHYLNKLFFRFAGIPGHLSLVLIPVGGHEPDTSCVRFSRRFLQGGVHFQRRPMPAPGEKVPLCD